MRPSFFLTLVLLGVALVYYVPFGQPAAVSETPTQSTAAQGSSAPQQKAAPQPTVLDLAKPVYLAKDAVECSRIGILSAYLEGEQAGGEAAGHRAVDNLFVRPREGCLRILSRHKVRVIDTEVSMRRLVYTECAVAILWGNKCQVRLGDLSN